jgi:hypothetical protein
LACSRLDVSRWLETLAPRDRRLAETLAMGESTGKAAKKFRISPGRISQMRRQLCIDWQAFQGELPGRCDGGGVGKWRSQHPLQRRPSHLDVGLTQW